MNPWTLPWHWFLGLPEFWLGPGTSSHQPDINNNNSTYNYIVPKSDDSPSTSEKELGSCIFWLRYPKSCRFLQVSVPGVV